MGHWLADVHSGSFAPAFTLSFHDSERSRKPQVRIASVVTSNPKKKDTASQHNTTQHQFLSKRKQNSTFYVIFASIF